jgi:hypothetical protein
MYYNDMVPLPMALLTIQARLQNHYYRNPVAVKHDAHLLATNAGTFNGGDSGITRLAEREFWENLCLGVTSLLSCSLPLLPSVCGRYLFPHYFDEISA